MLNQRIKKSMPFKFLSYTITSIEERRIFTRLEKFLRSIYYSTTTDFDSVRKIDWKDRSQVKRLMKILVFKLCTLLISIRSLVSIIWPTPYIRDLTCNGYHYLGNPFLANMAFLGGTFSGTLTLGLANQYLIIRGESYQMRFIQKIKYKRLEYGLNRRFNTKFYRKFNLISRGVRSQFVPLWLMFSFMYCSPSVIGYFDPKVNFSLIGELKN